jgi:hypothetical protein
MCGLCLRLRVPSEMCVVILSTVSVTLCVLVDMSNKPIEIFFTSLCVAMSAICGSGMGSDVNGNSGTYSEGRPIRSLIGFGPCDLLLLDLCKPHVASFFFAVQPIYRTAVANTESYSKSSLHILVVVTSLLLPFRLFF